MTDAVLGTSDALLAGLDPEQREVALATRGAVCVLAGAGTGKTRAITYRIAYAASAGLVNPAHVLALTFTVRAAGELRGRLRQLGAGVGGQESFGELGLGLVRASTFHAAALRQLGRLAHQTRLGVDQLRRPTADHPRPEVVELA